MALSVGFYQKAAGVLNNPEIQKQAMAGARDVGLRLDQRAPGVAPTISSTPGMHI